MEIYRPDSGEVLLARFVDSRMAADNPAENMGDFWRIYTNVKFGYAYPLCPHPHEVACAVKGGTWNDYNRVFLVQIARCDLNCWYCFVDPELRQGREDHGGWFSEYDVVEAWQKSGCRVLRLSGGEPTLASPFIFDLYRALPMDDGPYIWVDTALSTGDEFFTAYRDLRNRDVVETMEWAKDIAICGCFKGFTWEDANYITGWSNCGGEVLLDLQFEMARRLVEETKIDVFFYVPDAATHVTRADDVLGFFNRMREQVDEYAPLRTYILQIRNYAPTDVGGWSAHTGLIEGERPIDIWQRLCRAHYGPELCWLPQHQVGFARRTQSLTSG